MNPDETTPTFRELTETILAVHGPGDEGFQWFWSDNHDGRVHRILPEFWRVLRARSPNGSVRDVVASWRDGEMRTLYHDLLYPRED